MAIMDPREAFENETVDRFYGVKSTDRLTALGAADMRNFRILPDGSLEKRCGFRKLLSFPPPVRGVWEGEIEGETYFFAVSGNRVCRILDNGQTTSVYYFLPSSEGRVQFVFYAGRLYLFDGATLCRFLPSSKSFTIAEGYTPLYGYNWHPTGMGQVNEPLNLIQSRIRIHYLNTTGASVFQLPYTMKQVNAVYLDGKATSNYLLNYSTVTISEAKNASTVEICATLDDIFDRRSTVLKTSHATVYRDSYHETLLCCGYPGYFIYRSAPVSDEMLRQSTKTYVNSDPLYLPEASPLCVGSLQHPITALFQNDEQVLVMNDRSLWAIRHVSHESADMRIYLLRSDIGCSSPHGVTTDSGLPIVVCENGIYQLKFQASDPSVCSEECISLDLSAKLSPALLRQAVPFYHRATGELWLPDPFDTDGTVWVCGSGGWVAYDGIFADLIFERNGLLYFTTKQGDICFMDETLNTDDGSTFWAYYQSHYLSFSHPAFQKRSIRASFCADTHGGEVEITLENERSTHMHRLKGHLQNAPEFFDVRLSPGRFRFLRFRFLTAGSERIRIHFLSFSANQ